MERFAHVFEAHDRQILVRKGEDGDNNPAICMITMIDGAELSTNLAFTINDDEDQNEVDERHAALDRAFENVDALREMAEKFAERLAGVKSPFEALTRLTSV